MVAAMTKEEILRELQAIERALDDRIVIVRIIVDASGKTIATFRRSAVLRRQGR